MDDSDFTWRRLRDRINEMPEDRLDDKVQILNPSNEEPRPLDQGIGFGAVGYWTDDATRGSIDGKHHGEHYAILADHCPFGKYGDMAYTEVKGGWIGMKSGRFFKDGEDC